MKKSIEEIQEKLDLSQKQIDELNESKSNLIEETNRLKKDKEEFTIEIDGIRKEMSEIEKHRNELLVKSIKVIIIKKIMNINKIKLLNS